MAGDFWLFAAVSVAVVVVWAALLARLGLLSASDVRAWRRLAAMRGYERPASRLERVARGSALLRRVQDELDLGRLLAQAGRHETEAAFLGRTVFVALAAFAVAVALDTTVRLQSGDFVAPPWVALLVAAGAVCARFAALRGAARRRRDAADSALGDMMMLVAVITDGRGLQLDDAVRILARCTPNPALSSLVEGGWQRLVGARPHSTEELYRAIATAFDVPTFTLVADAVATTNVGIGERVTYTRVAQAVYQHRLGQARVRAARARILVTLPVAGMLLPLLLLLGAPTFESLAAGLGAG